MRIVQCTPVFRPSEGGTQRAVFNLSKELVEMGHSVSVFTYNTWEDSAETGPVCSSGLRTSERLNGIDIYRFSYSSLGIGLRFSAPLSYSLLKFLAKRRADIVHVQGFFNLPNVILNAICGKLTKTPLVLTVHALHEALFYLNNARSHLLRILAAETMKSVLANVDTFVALSQVDLLTLMNLGLERSRIHCVPNGVYTERFENHESEREVRRKYGLASAGRLILCVCRIARNKGLHNLILAGSRLRNKIDDSSILIVGPSWDRIYKDSLVDMTRNLGVSDMVKFREGIPDEDLASLYSQADLFVLPSEQETLPLVILEAMAAGCPLIATSVGGIPDIISNGENGLLVRPGNVEEIEEKILMLLNNDKLRRKLSEQGRKTAREYQWNKIAERILGIYSQCLSQRG